MVCAASGDPPTTTTTTTTATNATTTFLDDDELRADLRQSAAITSDPFEPDGPVILSRISGCLEKRVGRQRFAVWFAKSTRLALRPSGGGDALCVIVPNDFVSDWIGKHFGKALAEAVAEVLGCSLPVQYEVSPRAFEAGGEGDNLFVPVPSPAPIAPVPAADELTRRPSRPAGASPQVLSQATTTAPGGVADLLGPMPTPSAPPTSPTSPVHTVNPQRPLSARLRHELDSFVVGPANEFAYECCRSVADKPGGSYNPLFIHGHVGLGKTHLLQGLCRHYARLHPTGRWAYLTGEEFTNEFIAAVKANRVDAFRRKMRDLDLLVIDDVHFLGGKRATQEEFLHTFNAVEAMGKHVVLASDAHPKMIASFGESLINRFVSGMVVRVDAPARPLREEILRTLAARQGIEIGEDALKWIAQRVTQSVRELEGAVTRIAAHVRLAGRQANIQLAGEVLHDLDRQMSQPLRPEQIFEAVCEFFSLDRKELMSGRRQRTISLARSVAMFLTRKCTNLSYPDIAGRMGKRNHSTVISACRRIENAVKKNEPVSWTSSVGDRCEPAGDLVQRLEEQSRALACA